jgi:hypothetical protein
MDKKPKETTRSRMTLGGNVKTVTKSKSADAAGNKTKTRAVTRSTPGYGYPSDFSVTKQKTKQKFASGATRKVKTMSSSTYETPSVGGRNIDYEKSYSATKEKVTSPGMANKAKSLARSSNKSGSRRTTIGNDSLSSTSKRNYNVSKSNIKAVSKKIRKS